MSIYRYPDSPLIDEVTFKKTANGAARAYLHVREGTSPEQIKGMLQSFAASNLNSIPMQCDGKPTLEIRGFKKETDLLQTIAAWTKGVPQIEKEPEDHITWLDWLRKRSLQASGVAMAIADIGFIIYGIKESKLNKKINPGHVRDLSEALAGASYLAGSSVITLYGRNDQSAFQIQKMSELILQKAKEKNLTVPETGSLTALGNPRKVTALRKVDNFFRQYPSEIGNMMYFTAGTLIAQSALRHRVLAPPRETMTDIQIKDRWNAGLGDTALGATTMASGLIGTFLKEKASDPDKSKLSGPGAFWDWLKSNPLTMASFGYMGSTLCHCYTTYKERKDALRTLNDEKAKPKEKELAAFKRDAIPWRVLFVGATLVGEVLLAISSKGHGEGVVNDTSVDDSVIAVAADLIVKQPLHMQDGLIDYMGKFLGQPDVLALADKSETKQLRQQVEALRKNLWAMAHPSTTEPAHESVHPTPPGTSPQGMQWQSKSSAYSSAKDTINLADKALAWQSKLAARSLSDIHVPLKIK